MSEQKARVLHLSRIPLLSLSEAVIVHWLLESASRVNLDREDYLKRLWIINKTPSSTFKHIWIPSITPIKLPQLWLIRASLTSRSSFPCSPWPTPSCCFSTSTSASRTLGTRPPLALLKVRGLSSDLEVFLMVLPRSVGNPPWSDLFPVRQKRWENIIDDKQTS